MFARQVVCARALRAERSGFKIRITVSGPARHALAAPGSSTLTHPRIQGRRDAMHGVQSLPEVVLGHVLDFAELDGDPDTGDAWATITHKKSGKVWECDDARLTHRRKIGWWASALCQ